MKVIVACIFYCFSLISPWAVAETVLIGPLNVVSMATGEISPDHILTIRDGVIAEITPFKGYAGAGDAVVIDGRGGFLIAGLAEMHAHVPPKTQGEQKARDVLALYLANGITTARGMLGEPWHLELRDLLARGAWFGPRLITSGPSFNGRSVTSPEQAAARVREQVDAGYDFLKLHPGLESEEFAAIANAAHELEIPFAGHVSFAVGLDAALRQRQATIDHLDGYAQELVPKGSSFSGTAPSFFGLNLAAGMDAGLAGHLARVTASAGVWNVPTQSLLESVAGNRSVDSLLARPGMRFVSAGLKGSWARQVRNTRSQMTADQRKQFIEARRTLIYQLQKAGAGLLLGSDAPQIMNVPGFSIHEELAYLVDAGLTPLQALQSGTVNVALFFGEPDRGDTAPGYVADLVLLARNPLRDIRATTEILGVMRAGKWYDREQLDEVLAAVEGRGI